MAHILSAHICIHALVRVPKLKWNPSLQTTAPLKKAVRSTGMHAGIWVCIPPASLGWSEDNKNNLDRKFGFNLHIWKVVITCLLGTQARLSGPLCMLNKLAFPSLLDQIVHSKLMPRLMSSVPTLLIWKHLGSTGQGLFITTLQGRRDWHWSDLAPKGDWENTYPQGLDLNPVSPWGIWGKAFSPQETDLIFSDKSCNTGLLKVNETQPLINALSKFHLEVMPWKEELVFAVIQVQCKVADLNLVSCSLPRFNFPI